MKERLTGAIILVVLIVLLVPELLSGPKGPAASRPPAAGAASPSSEEPPLRSYTINLGDDAHSQSQRANGAAGTSGPPQGPPQPQAVGSQQTDSADSEVSESSTWDSPATKGQAIAPGEAQGGGVTGVTPPASSASRALTSAAAQASAATHGASPTPKAANASTAAHGATGAAAKPAVKASQPAPTAAQTSKPSPAAPRAEAPSKPAAAAQAHTEAPPKSGGLVVSGWGVQLGVFKSRENAERLALEVRVKGFKASVSPVTSGKQKLYRVRVGPTPDRSAAQELQTKLKASGRPGGTVVPYS